MAKPLSEINSEFEITRDSADRTSFRMPRDEFSELTKPVIPKFTIPQPDPVTPKYTLPQPDSITPKYTLPQPDPIVSRFTLPQPDPVTPKYTLPQPEPSAPGYMQPQPSAPRYTLPQPESAAMQNTLPHSDPVQRYTLPPDMEALKYTLPPDVEALKYTLPQYETAASNYTPVQTEPPAQGYSWQRPDSLGLPATGPAGQGFGKIQTGQAAEPPAFAGFEPVKPKFSPIQTWERYPPASENLYYQQPEADIPQARPGNTGYYAAGSVPIQGTGIQRSDYPPNVTRQPQPNAGAPYYQGQAPVSPYYQGQAPVSPYYQGQAPVPPHMAQPPDTDYTGRLRMAVKNSQDAPKNKKKRAPAKIPKTFTETANLRKGQKVKIDREGKKSQRSTKNTIADVLFYGMLLVMLVCVIGWVRTNTKPFLLFGRYALMDVLTPSMQNSIPEGSLVVVEKVDDPATLKVGDDITFYVDEQTTVTHQIVGIYPNYNDSNQIGFQTKGTSNSEADDAIVYDTSVVGRVVYHIPKLGGALSFLPNLIMNPKNLIMVGVVFVSIMIFSFSLRGLFSSYKEDQPAGSKHSKKGKTRHVKGRALNT